MRHLEWSDRPNPIENLEISFQLYVNIWCLAYSREFVAGAKLFCSAFARATRAGAVREGCDAGRLHVVARRSEGDVFS